LKFAELYLNILNKSFPAQELARGMLKTLEVITTSNTGTATDEKLMEDLCNVREELSKLDYA
jgi:hypothetical protein